MRRVAPAAVVAAVLAAALAAVLPAPVAPAGAQAASPRRLVLLSQTPYLTTGGDFTMRLRIDRSNLPPTAELAVTIHGAVQTRSEFVQTLDNEVTRGAALPRSTFVLGSLPAENAGEVTLRVPADLGPDDGVFPVRVELRDRPDAVPLERLTTYAVYLSGSHNGPKLAVSFVFPVEAPLALPPDGQREIAGEEELVASIAALDAVRGLPFALDPSPETVAALHASRDDRTNRALDALRRVAGDRPVVPGTFVPISLPALVAAGLSDEIGIQMERAIAILTEVLEGRLSVSTWIQNEPFDAESIDELVGRGIEQVVVAESLLDPIPGQNVTLSRPFVLAGPQSDVPAVAADTGLASHFTAGPNQALAAYHLLADLAVLWLDAPAADRRAVVAMPSAEWRATKPFLDALASGLNQHPVVEAVSLDNVFTLVTPAVTGRSLPLVRDAAPAAPGTGALADVVPDLRQARRRLTSLGTVLDAPTQASALLHDRLLAAQSTQLRTTRQRQAYIAAVETGIADHLDAIEMPTGRSITLTARRGDIPVTFQNRTGTVVNVVVNVQSDKLEFPEGGSRTLELARRNTTERFAVMSRTSGAFPLRITLESPDGNLLIGRANLTVRSTAASRVSLVVSLGAALFLAVWWARHARGRRARRLVPA